VERDIVSNILNTSNQASVKVKWSADTGKQRKYKTL